MNNPASSVSVIRHDWSNAEIQALFDQPFNDLLFHAQQVHRENFDPNAVQISTLLSIKTGACPEDCKYCSQSGHYNTGLEKEKLMAVQEVLEEARAAKKNGASRFCMGAAWKFPPDKSFPHILDMVRGVRELGMESCMTLGALSKEHSEALAEAGLDYYNHNIDTSRQYYEQIITTRGFDERLETLANVRDAGINVCCGGIIGMGETSQDRIGFLRELANLPQHPESVPINNLVKIPGTPLADVEDLEPFDFIRMIAVARIIMPKSHVRLSAGREVMNDQMQAMCFMAGANSIFYGEKLLTTTNPDENADMRLFARLGIHPMELDVEIPESIPRTASTDNTAFYEATQ